MQSRHAIILELLPEGCKDLGGVLSAEAWGSAEQVLFRDLLRLRAPQEEAEVPFRDLLRG
ncbi:hypothetical protein PALA111701_04280 [Paenibacillus lactis]